MFGRKKAKRNRRINLAPAEINITSLLDVLTVLLFFLIKSFAVSPAAIVPPEDLRLPASVIKDQMEESVTVVLTHNKLMMNEQVVMNVKDGQFNGADLGEDQRTIVKLHQMLVKEFEKKKALFEKAGGGTHMMPPGKILIQSDKRLKFKTVKLLLHTVASAGYTDYQFVVDSNEG